MATPCETKLEQIRLSNDRILSALNELIRLLGGTQK